MNLLKDNAYHVLGLDTSASQKDVSKRSKEILTRLKIDDVPEYDLDLSFFDNFRNENSVKKATSSLSTPKKQIVEYFFWLQIADKVDEEAVSLLRNGKFGDAAKIWKEHSTEDTIKSLLYKKNLAIFLTILLYKKKDKDLIEKSISLWSELINSTKFWGSFTKVYKLHDELGSDQEVIDDFKKVVPNYISDIYAELTKIHSDNEFVTVFSKNFGLKGDKLEEDVLNPIYKVINDAVEELDLLKVSDDGVLDKKESADIKRLIGVIQSELNKLMDLGLYEESKIKLVRDRAAATLRRLSIEVNNNLNETNVALGLSKIADGMSGTDSFRNKVQQDIKTLEENKAFKIKEERQQAIIDPIMEDFKNGNHERALQALNRYIYNDSTDSDLKETLVELKKLIEERIVKHGTPVKSGPTMWTLNGVGTKVYGDTLYFVFLFIPIIPLSRYTLTNHGDGNYSFQGKLELHQWQKIWKAIGIFVIIIFVLMLFSS